MVPRHRRFALAAVTAAAFAVALAACGRSSLFREELPEFPPETFGDGRDGDLIVTGLQFEPNTCRLLRSTLGSSLTVAGGTDLEAGSMLLLWQVKGAIAVSGTAKTLSEPGDAGRFEMLRAVSIDASAVIVERAPSILYKSSGHHAAQVCHVPEYENVVIGTSGALIARGWDGSVGTGGIITFLVKETLLFAGSASSIVASGRGMAGGLSQDGDNCAGTVGLDAGGNPNCGGRKGEGIDHLSFNASSFGRGNRANAGGGGSGADGGAGGGGNGGAGGNGGRNVQDSTSSEGVGGAAILTTSLRLLPGGGGGSGHSDDTLGREGAAGGGVVVIYARRIAGPGRIAARGTNATPPPATAGGAGGGAGGTVALVASSSTFTGLLDVSGGIGSTAVTGGHGPGGGGGGGRVELRGFTVGTAQVALSGGANGIDANAAPRGATSGSAGLLVQPE